MTDEADTEAKLAYLARELRALSAMPLVTKEKLEAANQAAVRLGAWMTREEPDITDEDHHFLRRYIIDVDLRSGDPEVAESQAHEVAAILTDLDARSHGASGPTRLQKDLMELGRRLRALADSPMATEDERDCWRADAAKLQKWISEQELVDYLPHELWHYLMDADENLADESVRDAQYPWFPKLLAELDRGDAFEEEPRSMSCVVAMLGFAVVLLAVAWYFVS